MCLYFESKTVVKMVLIGAVKLLHCDIFMIVDSLTVG